MDKVEHYIFFLLFNWCTYYLSYASLVNYIALCGLFYFNNYAGIYMTELAKDEDDCPIIWQKVKIVLAGCLIT